MKRNAKLIYTFLLFCIANVAYTQKLTVGLTANFGMSAITTNYPSPNGIGQNEYTFSGTWGFLLEKKIGNNAYLGLEALAVQIKGKNTAENIKVDSSDPGLIVIDDRKSHWRSKYLALPLYYKCELQKIGFRIGIQPMLFLDNNTDTEGELEFTVVNDNGKILANYAIEYDGEIRNLQLNHFDIGPKIGIDYAVFKNFRLRIDYYYGLINIESDEFPWDGKNRQVTMGLSFLLNANKT
jgi:hypothetical protein